MTTYWKWRVKGEHREAHRIPPWPMSEQQAARWAARRVLNTQRRAKRK